MTLKRLGLTGQLQGYIVIRTIMSAIILIIIKKVIKIISIINIIIVRIDMCYRHMYSIPS